MTHVSLGRSLCRDGHRKPINTKKSPRSSSFSVYPGAGTDVAYRITLTDSYVTKTYTLAKKARNTLYVTKRVD